jgi:hypothetical protein
MSRLLQALLCTAAASDRKGAEAAAIARREEQLLAACDREHEQNGFGLPIRCRSDYTARAIAPP